MIEINRLRVLIEQGATIKSHKGFVKLNKDYDESLIRYYVDFSDGVCPSFNFHDGIEVEVVE